MTQLPAIRLSQYHMETVVQHRTRLEPLIRKQSPGVREHCVKAGMPADLAELCSGLLASVVDDLVEASKLPRTNWERGKRLERVISAAEEPAVYALRLAIAASPINGRACARQWDALCDKVERGKLAWLIGLDTDTAHRYGRKIEKRTA